MTAPHFNGADYVPPRDDPRLSSQYKRIWTAMLDSKPRTLEEIAELTGDPPASVSAQLRHMRKPRFGAHTIEREHRGAGLYSYRLIVNLKPPVVPFDVPQSMTDLKAKGAADFVAKTKDEALFHNSADPGRLYREGWHAARRAAELPAPLTDGSGFEQTPVKPAAAPWKCPNDTDGDGDCHLCYGKGRCTHPDRPGSRTEPSPYAAGRPLEGPGSRTERVGPGLCDGCREEKPALTAIYCGPVAGACLCDDCLKPAFVEPKAADVVGPITQRSGTPGFPPASRSDQPESSPEVRKAPTTRGKAKAENQLDLFG